MPRRIKTLREETKEIHGQTILVKIIEPRKAQNTKSWETYSVKVNGLIGSRVAKDKSIFLYRKIWS